MAKDYAKFVPPKSRAAKKNKWRTGYVLAFLLVLAGTVAAGCCFYFGKTAMPGARSERVAAAVSKIVALVEHKKPSAKPVVVAANDGPPPVHFDFYNELPNMQMPTNDPKNVSNSPPPIASKPTAAPSEPAAAVPAVVKADTPVVKEDLASEEDSAPPVAATTVVAKTETPELSKSTAKPVLEEEDVSDLLAAEHATVVAHPVVADHATETDRSAPGYVVQLGVFQSESAANTLRDAISSVGFNATVVKVGQGKRKLYHVQQGPYETVAAAKQLQQRMEKRGIISIIQKSSV